MKQDVVSGKIPSFVADFHPFIRAGLPSAKRFHTPLGQMAQASETVHLNLQMRESALMVYMVPGLQRNSLISANKLAEANYLIIFTPDEVKISD